jgi:hypothetical protein
MRLDPARLLVSILLAPVYAFCVLVAIDLPSKALVPKAPELVPFERLADDDDDEFGFDEMSD